MGVPSLFLIGNRNAYMEVTLSEIVHICHIKDLVTSRGTSCWHIYFSTHLHVIWSEHTCPKMQQAYNLKRKMKRKFV